MWVEKTNSNTFKFSERFINPLTGKYNKVSVNLPNNNRINRKKAQIILEDKIQAKLRKIQDGHIKAGVTLDEVIKEWEPIYRDQVRDATWQTYLVSKKHIIKYIGLDTLVNNITPKFLIHAYEKMLYEDGYNNPTVRTVSYRMNSILSFAYKRDYISNQPIKTLDVNWKKNNSAPTDKFLEQSELTAILDYVRQRRPRYADIFEWQYLTGMRIGEVLGMQLKNITTENGQCYATVDGTISYMSSRVEDYYKQNNPKTESGNRTILLPVRAVEIYDQYRQGKQPNDFLFLDDNRFFSFTMLNEMLRRAKRDLKINKRVTTHIFRHTHVSKLAELGVPLYIIQDRVGHSDSAITREVYLHVTNRAKRKYNSTILKLK